MSDPKVSKGIDLTAEDGHAAPALLSLLGGAGAVALGIGVAADSDVLAVVGGVATGAGFLLGAIAEHMTVDYDIYRRLEELEKK